MHPLVVMRLRRGFVLAREHRFDRAQFSAGYLEINFLPNFLANEVDYAKQPGIRSCNGTRYCHSLSNPRFIDFTILGLSSLVQPFFCSFSNIYILQRFVRVAVVVIIIMIGV